MSRAFVIRPFGKKNDMAGRCIDFEYIHEQLICPALEATTDGGGTTGEIVDAGNIREDMFALIIEADLVLCDITIHNANVFYELGIRHALRQHGTVLIKGEPSDGTPFDLLTDRYLAYDIDAPSQKTEELINTIQSTLSFSRRTDSPIFQMVSDLPELDPERVQFVPLGFEEKVAQAYSSSDTQKLICLAREVTGERFERGGLRLIARAQSRLRDYEQAQGTWDTLRKTRPQDGEANIELARIYEQMYRVRDEGDPVLIEKSKQAIRRVLESTETPTHLRAEALQIRGRIQKTLWWQGFKDLPSIDARRRRAVNATLRSAYESYLKAFFEDLNVYYAGIAALELGVILLDLSESPEWHNAFDDDDKAEGYKNILIGKVDELRGAVSLSIEVAEKYSHWAELDRAYLLFLNAERLGRVVKAHQDAYHNISDGDGRRRQLEIFVSLGINADLAEQTISVLPHDR